MTAHSRNIALLAELFDARIKEVDCNSCEKSFEFDAYYHEKQSKWGAVSKICSRCQDLGWPWPNEREYEPED